MIKLLILISPLFFVPLSMNAQTDSIYIERRECVSEKNLNGYKLIIHFRNDSISQTAKTSDYYLDYLQKIDDKSKLKLIGFLLQYRNDTSLCCIKVMIYSFNGNEGCRGKPEDVTRYTVQVDALFMINRLVWPKLMEVYSCTPVLYDNKLKREINSNQKKINYVFANYKKWYEECKIMGKIPGYFPFNDGRYVWYGGRKSIVARN